MSDATNLFSSFLGGELSQFAQGRYDRPDYRISMRVCLNSFPIESGAWTRRPGTQYAGHTRGGAKGRDVKFDFEQAAPVTLEFTDGFLRFRSGARLLSTNDTRAVAAISTANPAVLALFDAVTWATGDTLLFETGGDARGALLQNRQLVATKVDTTHFSLSDPLTGTTIDGSVLGPISPGAQMMHVQELATPYIGGSWANIRAVQAETTDILLAPGVAPQALTVTKLPSASADAQFALSPATFNDGPYLDPFTNGVQAAPSAKTGIITLQLSFPTWDTTKAYAAGAFVTLVGVNYVSLQAQNVGHDPSLGVPYWATSSAAAAINDGRGFLGTDVGRLVRLFSEPAAWVAGTTYASGTVISYNPSGQPGAATYWQSLTAGNVGHAPGSDLTNWEIVPQGAAIWTWGRITSLSNVIDRALAGSLTIGSMVSGGGNASAFDGVFTRIAGLSAEQIATGANVGSGTLVQNLSYIGKDYSGASAQQIQQATVWPSSDSGIAFGTSRDNRSFITVLAPVIILNLRASNSPPASTSDGTLLGTSDPITNTTAPITIVSNNQTSTWNYVWVEQITQATIGPSYAVSYTLTNAIAEVSFFNPIGTGTSTGINLEILGPALLYTTTIATWRLGVYSATTGWPTCGCYDGGRLFLGGAAPNRWDACVSNGITGSTVNFAPTDQFGAVSAASAISYTFNSDSVNPIFWMIPDLQGILMGTLAGEWLVQAPTNGPLSPTNVAARRVTKIGCANVEPRRTEHTIVFVKRYGRKLMEYFADVYSGKFSAPNLADKAQHIPRSGIAELAYTEAVSPVIWGRNSDGSLFGITYKRDTLTTAQGPTFAGWHRHALGSGRQVESLCSGPSVNGDLDALTMVTNDSATGIRHVEILTDAPDELTTLASAWFLDDAVNPASASQTLTPAAGAPYGGVTLNGLWHLNGKTVQVFAGGLDCGDPGEGAAFSDFVVSNGSLFIPFGDGISTGAGRGLFTAAFFVSIALSQIVVGFTYTSDGQPIRPVAQADTGARNGPAFGKASRGHRFALKLVNALGISTGGNFTDKLYPALFKSKGGKELPALQMFSGVFFDQLRDSYTYEDSLCWRVSRPWPATITAAATNLTTQDQ